MKKTRYLQILVILVILVAIICFFGTYKLPFRHFPGPPSKVDSRQSLSTNTDIVVDSDASETSGKQDLWAIVEQQKLEELKAAGVPLTAELRKELAAFIEERRKAGGTPVLDGSESDGMFGREHHGEQSVTAIMETFNEMHTKAHGSDSEPDMRYPRAEWIQMLLDRGVEFKDYTDFSGYLSIRWGLVSAEKQSVREYSEYYGVSPNAPWAEYEDAYIKKNILFHEQTKQAMREDDKVSGGFTTSTGTFVPMRENTVFVKVNKENSGANFYGVMLSDAQREALVFEGIAPEGIEVVYLGADDKPISEGAKKPRLDWANLGQFGKKSNAKNSAREYATERSIENPARESSDDQSATQSARTERKVDAAADRSSLLKDLESKPSRARPSSNDIETQLRKLLNSSEPDWEKNLVPDLRNTTRQKIRDAKAPEQLRKQRTGQNRK